MQFKSKRYAVENPNYNVTFLLQFDYDSSGLADQGKRITCHQISRKDSVLDRAFIPAGYARNDLNVFSGGISFSSFIYYSLKYSSCCDIECLAYWNTKESLNNMVYLEKQCVFLVILDNIGGSCQILCYFRKILYIKQGGILKIIYFCRKIILKNGRIKI